MPGRTLIIVLFLVAVVGAACTVPGAAAAPPSSASPGNSAAAPLSTLPPLAPSSPSALGSAGGRLLFLRSGEGTSADEIVTVSPATGHIVARLPLGVADDRWSVLYVASAAGSLTSITAYDPRSGAVIRRASLPGSFRLPVVAAGGLPAGLTNDGRTLVLVDQAAEAGSSRFALVDTSFANPARYVTLAGDFAFDALSPDARNLYLIEHLGPAGSGHYQVRAYDSAAGALVAGPIVDKRNIDEVMEGRPVDRVTSADGQWVYTLYVKSDGTAFVHELDTTDAIALCVDLPDAARAMTATAGTAWRLAVRGNDQPYATNGLLGILVALDLGQVRSTGQLPAGAAGAEELAIAADGTALFVAGPEGLTTFSTRSLVAIGNVLRTPLLAGIAATGDGRSLYGVPESGTGIVEVAIGDPGAGTMTTVPVIGLSDDSRASIDVLAVVEAWSR